ncbi:hypothetical protein FB45DRAFT_1002607 [Roridomyces roridus]|uniref:Uncharacterized protein n=1 Tax=Roridomyces roridus TaxID=1738132 RepID=A0AAD7C1Z7_9AGAR|nr:hypothetical protein FB45DRAFT_1002607 [Roridomyces roridus]
MDSENHENDQQEWVKTREAEERLGDRAVLRTKSCHVYGFCVRASGRPRNLVVRASGPYDLDEVDRQDRDAPALVSRSSVRFEIADFIKLDSAALTELLGPSQKVTSTKPSAPAQPTVPVGRPDDYDIEDCFK